MGTRHQVQMRWKNIRARFSRELLTQKDTKSGQAASKRRKYVYFDKLIFLLPTMKMRSTSCNAATIKAEDEDHFKEEAEVPAETNIHPRINTKRPKRSSYEESLLEILQKKKETPDQDTNFALSLVPMLKELPMNKKLDAQIQILHIFKTINCSPQNVNQPGPSGIQGSQNHTTVNRFTVSPDMQHYHVTHTGSQVYHQISPTVTSTPAFSPIAGPSTAISPSFHIRSDTPISHPKFNSPSDSSDTVQSHGCNFSMTSDDSDLYDL